MLVFVFALGDVAKKETKMHFFFNLLSYAAVLLHFEVARKHRKVCRVLTGLHPGRAIVFACLVCWPVVAGVIVQGLWPNGHVLLLPCCCISELCSSEMQNWWHHPLMCSTNGLG